MWDIREINKAEEKLGEALNKYDAEINDPKKTEINAKQVEETYKDWRITVPSYVGAEKKSLLQEVK